MAENQYDFSNVSDETLRDAIRVLRHVSREWLDLFNGVKDTSFINFAFVSKGVRIEAWVENYSDVPDKILVDRNNIVAEFYQKMCECATNERAVLEKELQERIEARRLN
jgi:hypothetical protein